MIIGPTDTLFEGGFFKCHLIFPKEYPLRPPKLRVITDIWHPNIDKNGDVCISILHEPGKKTFLVSHHICMLGLFLEVNLSNNAFFFCQDLI